MAVRNLDIAVPGTYQSGKPVIGISYVLPTFQVINSKQRPRKFSMRGRDGKDYTYCLKGVISFIARGTRADFQGTKTCVKTSESCSSSVWSTRCLARIRSVPRDISASSNFPSHLFRRGRVCSVGCNIVTRFTCSSRDTETVGRFWSTSSTVSCNK